MAMNEALELWDDVMVSDLKYFDGSLAKIDRVPAEMRNLYATAFEVDASWIERELIILRHLQLQKIGAVEEMPNLASRISPRQILALQNLAVCFGDIIGSGLAP